jgi:hypothetical protein
MGWIKLSIDETCHLAWAVRAAGCEYYLHAVGDGAAGNRVTQDLAKMRFDGGKFITPWLPVLFPRRAVTEHRRSINCVTAGMAAMMRGWLYIG